MMGIFLHIPRLIFLQTCKIDGIIFGEQIAKGRYIPRFFFSINVDNIPSMADHLQLCRCCTWIISQSCLINFLL